MTMVEKVYINQQACLLRPLSIFKTFKDRLVLTLGSFWFFNLQVMMLLNVVLYECNFWQTTNTLTFFYL